MVPCFLITTDRAPKGVMLHGVAVQELDRCALLSSHNVRGKPEPLLCGISILPFWVPGTGDFAKYNDASNMSEGGSEARRSSAARFLPGSAFTTFVSSARST